MGQNKAVERWDGGGDADAVSFGVRLDSRDRRARADIRDEQILGGVEREVEKQADKLSVRALAADLVKIRLAREFGVWELQEVRKLLCAEAG